MPNHVHWIIELDAKFALSTVIGSAKSNSARVLNRKMGRSGPFWQAGYHDHAVRSEAEIKDVARYIVANPLRAGLVDTVGMYPHWDAIWL